MITEKISFNLAQRNLKVGFVSFYVIWPTLLDTVGQMTNCGQNSLFRKVYNILFFLHDSYEMNCIIQMQVRS